mgnify:FL=1
MKRKAAAKAGAGPSLFVDAGSRPLADRLRPTKLDEVVGQDHLLKGEGPLARMAAGPRG